MCVQKRELWSVLSPSALTILHCESVKDTYPHMNQGEIIDTHSVLEVTGFRDAVTLTCCPRQPCSALSADEIAAQIQITSRVCPLLRSIWPRGQEMVGSQITVQGRPLSCPAKNDYVMVF